jgi:hypothetical protein
MASPTPIQYPYINGVRHSFASVEFKFNGIIFIGIANMNYSRTRTRTMVRGNHPDPLGKTIGENEYSADCELYLAEWNQFQASLGTNGAGYGDDSFTATCVYTANGFDMITDTILGCTLDVTEAALAKGTDPVSRKIQLSPLKILFNGLDDLAVPLVAPAQT